MFQAGERWDLFGSNGKAGDNILLVHNAEQPPQVKASDRNLLHESQHCNPRLTSADSRLEQG